MTVRTLLVVWVILALGFAPAPLPRPSRNGPQSDDLKRLQGEWVVVEQYLGGKRLIQRGNLTHLHVVKDNWSFCWSGSVRSQWTAKLTPSASPRTLDLHGCQDRHGDTLLAIYRFDGEQVTISYDASKRPTKFDPNEADFVMVLKRR